VVMLLKDMYNMLDVVRNENEQRRQKHYTLRKYDLTGWGQLPAKHFIRKMGGLVETQKPVIIEKIEPIHPELMTDADKKNDANAINKIGTVNLAYDDKPFKIMMPVENSEEHIARDIDECIHNEYSTITY